MGVDLAAIRRRMTELQSGRKNSNVQLWKPKLGNYVIRAVPWPENLLKDGLPFVERWFYYIGEGRGHLTLHQFGKADPIHEFIGSLWKSGTEDDKNIAKKLRAKMQAYLPIIVKEGEGADPTKVILWSINKFVYQKMLGWFTDEEIGDYIDVKTGYDIKVAIVDSGKKFNNKPVLNTDLELARKQSKLADTPEQVQKLRDAVPNIDDVYTPETAAELEAALNRWLSGGTAGDDGSSRGGNNNDKSTDGVDALDQLVNEVAGKPADAPVETKSEDKSSKKKTKKPADEDLEDAPAAKQSLDAAFDELMADDDEA
jgi:hypothetical protein